MNSLSNDVKSIIFKYMYDQVIGQICDVIPKYNTIFRNIYSPSYLKKKVNYNNEYRIRTYTSPSNILFCQDFSILDINERLCIQISIIDGSIYEIRSFCGKMKLKKISCNSIGCCWTQLRSLCIV